MTHVLYGMIYLYNLYISYIRYNMYTRILLFKLKNIGVRGIALKLYIYMNL